MLREHGVGKGDRVAVVLPPTPETAAIFFGTWKLGAILLSMSVLYGDDGIRHRLEDSDPKRAGHRRRQRAALRPLAGRRARWSSTTATGCSPATRPTRSARTPPPTTRPSSTTRRGPRARRRASSTPTATSSPTRSSSTATTSATASASTAWASGPGPRGSRRCSARGGSARSSTCYQREAGFVPADQLDFLSRHEVTNVFTTPTAMRAMMAIERRRRALPAGVPDRLLGRRAAQPGGDPLVPRAVRGHRARLLRAHRVLSAVRELPLHGGPRGLDGPADAGLGRAAPRRGREPGRAGRARRDLPARPLQPALPARLLEPARGVSEETFGGEWFHTKDAATQDEDGYVWYAGPRRRRDHRRRLPDRPVRGRVGLHRAPRRRRGGRGRLPGRGQGQRRQGVHRPRRGPRAAPTSSPTRSSASSASASAPTPTRAGSSSSTSCRRR